MQLHQNRPLPMHGQHNHNHNGTGTVGPNGQVSSDDCSNARPTNNRRKKASRACFHCQKAHLTCDDARPCQRCVKRDLAGSCTDGVRKKAKYLQESQQRAAEQAKLEQQQQQQQQAQTTTISRESPLDDAQALFGFPHVASSITITSLSSLSSLNAAATASAAKATSPLLPLLSLSPTNSRSSSPTLSTTSSSCISSTSSTTTLVPDYGFESEALNLEYSILSTMLSSPTAELQSMTSEMSMVENWQRQGALEAMANSLQQQHQQQGHLQRAAAALSHNSHNNNSKVNITTNDHHLQNNHRQQQNVTGLFGNQNNNISQSNRVSKRKFPSNTPENVYANTKAPFNYTEGFHYLLQYVRERMDKEEMMRVCRAMAMFRPSFIALIMNLTPEDLIFMETCFQRTVLLLNKKTYIYELMDNQSAVEYWEKFSTHAFENTEQTVMTTCILLSPTQRVVPCTFCFTIKRDIFDIPLAIVGNFLPILS
ncbi:Transcriptional regulator of nonfermentable carbon utilization [Linnemannia gamsii]|uniref:Transcriptional regulator of nonfermentable carbon utilization n=1 Tax=Linnemannia gamsii TaxID=64522 RepID=A0ABQ7JL34_9FUNG|nr:Transcriptional regulator of nonfermentable carbon utilization [Linnemannia gamsii]